jgi:hypothetical protein
MCHWLIPFRRPMRELDHASLCENPEILTIGTNCPLLKRSGV